MIWFIDWIVTPIYVVASIALSVRLFIAGPQYAPMACMMLVCAAGAIGMAWAEREP